jgi:methylated-DNA-[protein]-cysteine S-methyltransferase
VIARRAFESPVGRIVLEASARGLCAVRIGGHGHGHRHGESAAVSAAERALRRYFDGGELAPMPPLDLGGLSEFRKRVSEALARSVPAGRTVTYGELAALVGSPGAARAVGRVMATNPLPIFVPCHRVLASGGPGGFGPGIECKRWLLALEGVALPA